MGVFAPQTTTARAGIVKPELLWWEVAEDDVRNCCRWGRDATMMRHASPRTIAIVDIVATGIGDCRFGNHAPQKGIASLTDVVTNNSHGQRPIVQGTVTKTGRENYED